VTLASTVSVSALFGGSKTFKNIAPGGSTHPLRVVLDLDPDDGDMGIWLSGSYVPNGGCGDVVGAVIFVD
jgi:hypothetical protein